MLHKKLLGDGTFGDRWYR